jgi:SynChlorMet cassette radical SAM/SPASM protein ScmE
MLSTAGFPVTVRVTVNHHNVDDLENIAALLFDDVGLPGFSTNEAEQMGTAQCNGQDVTLTREERSRASILLSRLNQQYENRISADAGPLAIGDYFAEIDSRVAAGEKQMPGCGTLSSCGGVFHKMDVLHDGTMVPCNMLPALAMGKIGSTPLQQAWLHHPAINAVRQRREIPLRSLPGCSDCEYTGFCAGGCPAVVMAKSGTLHEIDPTACYRLHRQQEIRD